MTIPFAITVPSVLYLLLHAGLAGLKGIGLVSWGSMNSFTLTAIPLFILMAEILQESKLSLRVYHGLSTLVAWMPGGLLQTNIAGCAIFAAISGSSVATAASIGARRAAAIAAAQLQSAAVGGLARGGRHARHSDSAEHRDDRLWHVHRDLGGEAVHGRRRAGLAADRDVHGLHRRARAGSSPRSRRASTAHARSSESLTAAARRRCPSCVLIGGTIGSIYAGW